MEYPAPKLVLPIFNPADFSTTINTAVSSFTQEQQAEINALIEANNALIKQINTATTNLGKVIRMNNEFDRNTIPGSTYTPILYIGVSPGTYLVSVTVPFSAPTGQRTPTWTSVTIQANTGMSGNYQNSVNYPPSPAGNAFIGVCEWVNVVTFTSTVNIGFTMNIQSAGGINDLWYIGTLASIGFSPLSPGANQSMIRCIQIR